MAPHLRPAQSAGVLCDGSCLEVFIHVSSSPKTESQKRCAPCDGLDQGGLDVTTNLIVGVTETKIEVTKKRLDVNKNKWCFYMLTSSFVYTSK